MNQGLRKYHDLLPERRKLDDAIEVFPETEAKIRASPDPPFSMILQPPVPAIG